jgi:predicted DNA-binding transcriptional regulator AlpA
MAERLYSIQDLSDREGVPVATIYGWNSRGIGPTYLKLGRHVRYRLNDVIAWEDEDAIGAETGAPAA